MREDQTTQLGRETFSVLSCPVFDSSPPTQQRPTNITTPISFLHTLFHIELKKKIGKRNTKPTKNLGGIFTMCKVAYIPARPAFTKPRRLSLSPPPLSLSPQIPYEHVHVQTRTTGRKRCLRLILPQLQRSPVEMVACPNPAVPYRSFTRSPA